MPERAEATSSIAATTALLAFLALFAWSTGRRRVLVLGLLPALAGLGWLRAAHVQRCWRAQVQAFERAAAPWIVVEGEVASRARRSLWGFECQALLDLPGRPRVRMLWEGGWRPLPGDRWQGACRLEGLEPPGFPGRVDPRSRSRLSGSCGLVTPLCLFGREDPSRSPYRSLQRFLAWSGDRLERHLEERLSPPAWRFLGAFLLGRRELLDPECVKAFRETGTAHLLAISGLHVGFISLALSPILGWTGRRRRLRLLLWCLLLGTFAGLTGGAPPVWRAGAMIVAHQVSRLRGSRRGALAGWWLGLAAECWIRPASVTAPSFTLSYAAALGLVLAARRGWLSGVPPQDPARTGITGRIRRCLAVPLRGILQTTKTSAVVLIVTGPLLLAYFDRWLPLSILHNIVLIPAAGVTLAAALAGVVLGQLPGLPGEAAWTGVELATRAFLGLQELLGRTLPDLVLPGEIPVGVAIVLSAGLAAGLMGGRWGRWGRRCAVAVAAVLIGKAVVSWEPPGWSATFLSLGRGEAIVLRWADGRTWLVDTGPGGRPPRSAPIVAALRGMGLERLDRVFITHGEWDHCGALEELLRVVSVGTVVVGAGGYGASGAEPDRIEVASAGWYASPARGVTVRILHPERETRFTGNNASLVLLIEGWGMRLLLAGDLETEGEEELLRGSWSPRADLLKLGHHGRDTSTGASFLRAVAPLAAVAIGSRPRVAGEPQVVEQRLRRAGVILADGSRCGAMQLEIRDGEWVLRPLFGTGTVRLCGVRPPPVSSRGALSCGAGVRVL